MTKTLAEAKPRELGLRRNNPFDSRLYLDENKRRCETWLAGVKASQPLEDIAFAQGPGVELEIPEENWEDLEKIHYIKTPHNSSASSSDDNMAARSKKPVGSTANHSHGRHVSTRSSSGNHTAATSMGISSVPRVSTPTQSHIRDGSTNSLSCQPASSRDGRLAIIQDVTMETDNENEEDVFPHHYVPGYVDQQSITPTPMGV